MAAKVGNLIGSKTATTFCFSITNTNTNSRTSTCASNTTSSITQETRKYLRIGIRHISSRAPSPLVQATSGPSGSNSDEPNSPFPSTFQDELKYLLKLVIGSILGAAVIKYGSAAIPTITRPDITVALSIISTPSVIAVLLLAKESRKD